MRHCRIWRCALLALALPAQQQQGPAIFKTTSSLVIVDVTATDKSGKPIEGLRVEDFTVLTPDETHAHFTTEDARAGLGPAPPR